VLPSLGTAQVSSGPAVLRTAGGTAEIASEAGRVRVPADPHHDGRGWLAVRRISIGSLSVLVDDSDPFRMPAVPDLAPRLDGPEVGEWEAAFQSAWSLLTRHHPDVAEEAATAIRVIVPIARPPHGQRSSSSAETFGAIALSQPRDVSLLAETMIHEVQHLKLCALADLVALTRRDDGRRFYAPWRDDPRPASGLLQGAYAYLGVSRFWRQQRHLAQGEAWIRAHAEFARWRSAASMATSTLTASGQLTETGEEFVRGMAQTLRAWQDERVPEESRALARREADEHLARWTSAHASTLA
jgi:HEXXH motif-containing protein